tara:strand:+ start:533 stop:1123 length:591 start_codon:yes stop_codon:yes gene_type:complete
MNYLDWLEKNIFSGTVENQSVLELGALNNKITNVIGRCNPKSIYTVDPEPSGKPDFKGTANDFYAADHFTEPYDVVVCMGLLYHLHSPWHLVELIINHSRPKILILETANSINHVKGLSIAPEEYNTFGNAYADKEIKYPMQIHSSVTRNNWIEGIETTPMKLQKHWIYRLIPFEQDDFFMTAKQNMWMGVFKWED